MAPSWSASRPVASALVVCDERRDTVITLPNVWGPLAADYEATIDLYAEDGAMHSFADDTSEAARLLPIARELFHAP